MVHEVVEVDERSAGEAAGAVAEGFLDNEIWSWLVPSERRRRRLLPRYYRTMIRRVFVPRGGAWTTADRSGGALWLPPDSPRLGRREQLAELTAMLPWGLGALRRGPRLDALLSVHRPDEPHWYLNTLSVRPAAQGTGVGSALIGPGLERADAAGLPCWLETQRRSNIPFYRRFGFELVREVSTADSPPLWLMWREAADGGLGSQS